MEALIGPGGPLARQPRLVGKGDLQHVVDGWIWDSSVDTFDDAKAAAKEEEKKRVADEQRAKGTTQRGINRSITATNAVDIAPYSSYYDIKAIPYLKDANQIKSVIDGAKGVARDVIKDLKVFPAKPHATPANSVLTLWSRNHINWRRLTSHGYSDLVDPALTAMIFEHMYIKLYRKQLFKASPAARLLRKEMTAILDPHGGQRLHPKTLELVNRWEWIDAQILDGVDESRDGDKDGAEFDAKTIWTRMEMLQRRSSMSSGMDAVVRMIYRAEATNASNGKTGKEEASAMPKEIHDALKVFMRVSAF